MREPSELELVRAAVVAVYQEGDPANEIGVYGLRFSDPEVANGWLRKLTADRRDSPFILQGALLLYVWSDDGVSAYASQAIRDLIEAAKVRPASP